MVAPTTSAMSTEHRHPNFMPFFTRSGRPAPTFWLTNVASAMAKQVTGRKAKPSTLLYAPHPAMACAPNELMLDCTMTLAIEMTEFWMPDGRPCTMTAFSDGPSNFTSRQCTAHASWERVSLANARTALTVWEAIVANAAAATPMRSQPTRIRSSTMLMREAAIKYRIGLLLSPTDCRMLAPTLYMTTAIEPMKYMRK